MDGVTCIRCERNMAEKSFNVSMGGQVNWAGLSLCVTHAHELKVALAVARGRCVEASDDPERLHGIIDDLLLAWAPQPLAEFAKRVRERADWWADA